MSNSKWAGLCFSMLMGLGHVAWGQGAQPRYELKGTVKNAKTTGVSAANIQLTKEPGGALVKVEVSAGDGRFVLENIPAGTYKLVATHYEYAAYQSPVINLNQNIDLGDLVLPERAVTLKEVAVAARKPFIEQQFDKTVLNVENSISAAGSTALEVLEKAPGITVDQNDNIAMRGRQGVVVMIDGKRVPMSGQELANMLRGMSANSVEKIDLITNPSAKYDAAGNAGIIDIRLKKDKRMGTNGTFSSSAGHGIFAKTNQGLNLNHRNKKLNLFGSHNYVYRRDFTKLDIYRNLYQEGVFSVGYDQKNQFNYTLNNNTSRLGLDYYASPKTILGFVGSGFISDINRTADNNSLKLNEQGTAVSSFKTDAVTGSDRLNGSLNLNLKHTIDSTGRDISADLDYAHYDTKDLQNFTTNYYGLNGQQTDPTYLLFGDLNGKLTIKSAKVDYAQPLKAWQANLEAGWKSSWVNADNNLEFFDRSNGGNKPDAGKSNHFIYAENINAAYVNGNKKWDKYSLQLGLRMENTNADGLQLSDGKEFDRNYTQLFPSAFVGYNYSQKHSYGLSLSRRIERPTYNQLNPFKFYLDFSTYSAGNPFLKPQLTYSFEFTHTYNQKITAKYSYSRTSDNIISVLSPDPANPLIVIQQDRNLALNDYYSIELSVPVTLGTWFNSINNANMYYSLFRGNLANTNLRNGRPTYNLNSNNTFTLSKTWSAEVIGVFRGREVYGFLDVQPIWFLSAGVQRQLWQKKGNIKLNVTDGFYTNKVKAFTQLTDYAEDFYQRRDSRVATLSFTYRFGGNQVAPARRRTGGAEDEKRRAN